MPEWVWHLWIFPVELLLILWAAFIVLALKGLLFHRHLKPPQPAHPPPDMAVTAQNHIDEQMQPQGLGLGCSLCLLFIFWPLFLADRFNKWLISKSPPKGSNQDDN